MLIEVKGPSKRKVIVEGLVKWKSAKNLDIYPRRGTLGRRKGLPELELYLSNQVLFKFFGIWCGTRSKKEA